MISGKFKIRAFMSGLGLDHVFAVHCNRKTASVPGTPMACIAHVITAIQATGPFLSATLAAAVIREHVIASLPILGARNDIRRDNDNGGAPFGATAASSRYRGPPATSTGFFPHDGHGDPTQAAYATIASSLIVANCDSA